MPRGMKPIRMTRGGLIGTAVVLLVAVVCARLGYWQLERLAGKRARNAAAEVRLAAPPVPLETLPAADTAGVLLRSVIVGGGYYDDARTVIIAGRALKGVPGVYVLTPLRIGRSAYLVNRGWMPSADAARINVDSIREPAPDSAAALIVELSHDPRAPERDTSAQFRRVWYHASMSLLQHQLPYPIAPYIVQLLPASGAPPYPVRLEPPELDEGPHLGYAIQWFSFAVIAVVGWLILMFRRKSSDVANERTREQAN